MNSNEETWVVFANQNNNNTDSNAQGWVVFAEQNNFVEDLGLEVEVEYVQQHQRPQRVKRCPNPYTMNRNLVTVNHFLDGRLYDDEITEPGWQVPRTRARKEYNKWLETVRQNPGWENFRRPVREVEEEVQDENGNTYVVRRLVTYGSNYNANYRRPSGPNNRKPIIPQSRDKGVKIDDVNFRPKMFTEKMGREISKLRNNVGLTQAELAKRINIDANMVRNIELGGLVTFNSEDVMVKSLAKALGVASIKYQE